LLAPIAVRQEGAASYRLIAGGNRLEAWKRCVGEQRPMPANVYPPNTPDALITILEIEENLFRKELTAAERQAETIRLAAALKELEGGKPVTPISASGKAAETGNLIPSLAAGAGRPRQQGYGAAGRREGRHRQARGEHEAEVSRGGDR
jgi:ParB-like chromosome segregation protein Spo0J